MFSYISIEEGIPALDRLKPPSVSCTPQKAVLRSARVAAHGVPSLPAQLKGFLTRHLPAWVGHSTS